MIDPKTIYHENDSDSMEDCRSYKGLTCTCPKDDTISSNTRLTTKKLLYIPFGNYKKFNSSKISPTEQSNEKVHNGSVSLSQILGDKRKDVDKNPINGREISHSYSSPFISSLYNHQRQTKDLTSSGSSRYGSPDASPEGFEQSIPSYRKLTSCYGTPDESSEGYDQSVPSYRKLTHCNGVPDASPEVYDQSIPPYRKLTPFERDNILYIQELKEKQREALQNLEKQVQDLPNLHLRQNHFNESIIFDKYPLDESAPRGGSPFPRRREYPPTAFSPSKAAASKALRSLSLEEETEEEDVLDRKREKRYSNDNAVWETFNDSFYNSKGNGGGRKMWPSPNSESHSLSAWWTNLPPSPNSMSPLNSPSFRRKSSSSISSFSKTSAPSPYRGLSVNSTKEDYRAVPLISTKENFLSPKRRYSYRSLSSPATSGDSRSFDPQDLSLAFVNFEELKKCRPDLEDVGGRVGSILSNSSEEEIITKRTMLPPTVETKYEDLSDEDTARKNQQPEAKTHQNGEPVHKSHPHSNSISPPSPSQKPTSPPEQTSQNDTSKPEPPKTPTTEIKKPSPMAFTVDFEAATSDSSASGNSGKKLDIAASLSQWVPKHRRNLSLTKVDEHKKVEERQGSEKPPLGRPRSGTVGAGPPGAKRGGAGYHSEGYFSSDQDDDGPKRSDLKSPRSPRTPDTVQAQPSLVRSNSQDSSKGNSLRMRPPSPLSPTSPYGAPLNETASFLIEKMMNATPETKRKFSTKPEGRSCCKERERKPSVSELTGKTHRADKKMGSDSKKQGKNAPVDDFDDAKDDKDDVSEAGTYTIDKDSPSPEEDQARNDIDGVFGVATESEAEMTSTTTTAVPMSTTDQCQEDESSWLSASEMPPPTISRNSPNWIQQWAAQVAEQTKPPIDSLSSHNKSSVTSPRGHKLPLGSQENNDSRPRRKLPTPPSHLSTTPTGLSQRSDPASAKHRLWHDSTMHSDMTSDTEGYLRDTENIVTSLQARVDKTKSANPAFRNTSFESHESGADSDFDTSMSYPFNDDERMSASLKSKLRLTGLMPQSKVATNPSAGITSPRRPDGGAGIDSKLKSRDPSYEIFRRDERGLHSDSSSEASEPYKDVVRSSDKNPPLKFNRAFSLRRARLGCEDPVSTSSIDKKKANRASSAGNIGPARKGTLGTSKSYQNVDSASVSSPRSYGYGSPRGIASPSQNVGGTKGAPQADNFDRTDGGRYSLRLPRSGSTSIGLAKSPSKSNIKKDSTHNKKNATRSNSTLSSKEVDFQNWKRRKNYDPMKAAAEGRKKQVEKKVPNPLQSSHANSENRSPSPPGSLLRSASFHGTEGVMCNLRWNRKPNNVQPHYTSEDDGPYSFEEEIGPHPSPRHGSPLHRSPTSPHQICQSPSRHPPVRGRRPSLGHSDEGDSQFQTPLRKVSLDESGSEGKRSPLNSSTRGGSGNTASGSGRPKTKMEALDNLVISTIHSLSVKVRTTSESLLQKLKSQYDEEGDRAALLEEVLSHLSESDQTLSSGQTRSTSRELAGILRNLKKIEHALEVIDRVIIVGEEDYRDDDIDYVPTEWVEESDY